MINRKNYEIYALDYIEGKLKGDIKREFERFLSQNPDIAEEIFSIYDFPVPKNENISFADKLDLKKSEIEGLSYFDELCIGDVEGVLNLKQKRDLNNIIDRDEEKLFIYEQYRKTKLSAPKVFYPYKADLKRKRNWDFNFLILYKIAALILVFFSLITFWKSQTNVQNYVFNTAVSIEEPNFVEINRPVKTKISKYNPNIEEKNYNINSTNEVADTEFLAETRLNKNNETRGHSDTFDIKLLPIKPISIIDSTQIALNSDDLLPKAVTKDIKPKRKWLNKLSKIGKKKNIIISKNRIQITVNDKTYGICLSQ